MPFLEFFLPLTIWRLIGFYWNFEGVWIEYKFDFKNFLEVEKFFF